MIVKYNKTKNPTRIHHILYSPEKQDITIRYNEQCDNNHAAHAQMSELKACDKD